jgi:Bacterial proteasome assembling chaperone-like protein
MLMLTSGKGKYKVWLKQEKIGANLLFVLGGGEKSHIGGIVVCDPGKKAKAVRLEGHFDDIVLKPIAEAACKKYKTKVVAVGGIHVDNATKKEIARLVENCRAFIKKL